jgi:hypothetical protein
MRNLLENRLPLFDTSLDLTGWGIYRREQVLNGFAPGFPAGGPKKSVLRASRRNCSRMKAEIAQARALSKNFIAGEVRIC